MKGLCPVGRWCGRAAGQLQDLLSSGDGSGAPSALSPGAVTWVLPARRCTFWPEHWEGWELLLALLCAVLKVIDQVLTPGVVQFLCFTPARSSPFTLH